MGIRFYDAYAGPFRVWGPWVNIDPEIIGGKLHLSISASSVTQAPGAFEGQVHYFAAGATSASLDTWGCPGATQIDVADSIQQMKVRFRAFVNGFAVAVKVDDGYVPAPRRSPILERKSLPLDVDPPTYVAGRQFGAKGIIT